MSITNPEKCARCGELSDVAHGGPVVRLCQQCTPPFSGPPVAPDVERLERDLQVMTAQRDAGWVQAADTTVKLDRVILDLVAAQAESERLRNALKKYGEHRRMCNISFQLWPCNCGLDAALTVDPQP